MKNKNDRYIVIEKATEHNLKNISLKIPHHQITCFTGVSGSGKSSLVYDIIAKESQRRYFETFSSYARQFVGKMGRPEVERIEGLMPAISVDQKTVNRNPRSTVGTMSEIYDYLRLLFARIGEKPAHFSSKLTRSLFSFNNPEGYCPHCKGLGVEDQIDPELLIKDPDKTLRQGALKITTPSGYTIYSQVTIDVLNDVCQSEGFHVDIPWKDLSDKQRDIILNGSDKIKIPYGKHTLESRMKWSGITAKPREEGYYKGILPVMENILRVDRNPNILRFAKTVSCKKCKGNRLNEQALSIKIDHYSIIDLSNLSITKLKETISNIHFRDESQNIAIPIVTKITERCETLEQLGLGYLSLMRESTSLSGGEAQRIRLATQIGNGLRGILYILDEPSVGLHPRDNQRMISVMHQLRNQGNTVLVVEHDKNTMYSSDQIVDIGPLAGKNGGEILFNEPTNQINQIKNEQSQTLQFLRTKQTNALPKLNTKAKWLSVKGACLHNLKNIDAAFKLHTLNVVTGVSGAGKSTLIFGLIARYYDRQLKNENTNTLPVSAIESESEIHKIIEIDQSPIGRTPRSNPATYTKLFDLIRKLFASLPEAKKKKWNQGHFSFNTKGGRCETCEGAGSIQTGMHFLSNVETICETCQGKRYTNETLEITYKGKNISEILDLEISEARDFFREEEKIHQYLNLMENLGLGYISLGQSATTLSGGEAQRLKLAAELVKPGKLHTLYLFDEPTSGLHSYDIQILIKALKNLTKKGHTVIVIEHDQEIIQVADHIVDLGPEGGEMGGEIVFSGNFENLKSFAGSYTGQALNNEFDICIPDKIDLDKIIDAPISLKGVRTHNLKNIDLDIPRNQITVITGVSGSGKSSFAFDTLFAEGQFRYTESFSTYARSLIQQKAKPDIAESSGLTPTIAIDSKSASKNPRATVGTITGLYDLYRLLFSRISKNPEGKTCSEYSSFFSFNHQAGACVKCNGLGFEYTCDPEKLITNPELSLPAGAMKGSKPGIFYGDPYGQYIATLQKVGETFHIDFGQSWLSLNDTAKKIALYGTGEKEYDIEWKYKRKNREGVHRFKSKWIGLCHLINDEFLRKQDKQGSDQLFALMKQVNCSACNGNKLKPEVLNYRIAKKTIAEISQLEAKEALLFFNNLRSELSQSESKISEDIIRSVIEKLEAMCQIGLNYLRSDRSTMTLSGGESRRVRMISQLGGELTGITYVLDEPTVGLHPKDSKNLIYLLQKLAEHNTVVVVEHDADVIKSADYIIELGPEAGEKGGNVVAKGSMHEFLKNQHSITQKYLQDSYELNIKKRDLVLDNKLIIKKARVHNLKEIDLQLPVNGISLFSGVSGSGKTSLVFDVIGASAKSGKAVGCNEISGLEHFHSIASIDQSAIGNNPLSTPITYLGLYDEIRNLFAQTDQAKTEKLKAGHFSFNSKQGQCNHCKGQGQIKVSMDFLSDVYVQCPVCSGKRFNENILKIKWNRYSVFEILEKTIREATEIYRTEEKLFKAFSLLNKLGLGHLKLGQPANTLSGGESQRIKLAKELIKQKKEKCLYLLDEPTTGLHFADIEKLLEVLFELRDHGHALFIIEHHPWFSKIADFTIELGPEGGEKGGYIINKGA